MALRCAARPTRPCSSLWVRRPPPRSVITRGGISSSEPVDFQVRPLVGFLAATITLPLAVVELDSIARGLPFIPSVGGDDPGGLAVVGRAPGRRRGPRPLSPPDGGRATGVHMREGLAYKRAVAANQYTNIDAGVSGRVGEGFSSENPVVTAEGEHASSASRCMPLSRPARRPSMISDSEC